MPTRKQKKKSIQEAGEGGRLGTWLMASYKCDE